MPRTKPPESAEDIAIRQIDDEDTAAIERIAREMGPPPDTQRLSEREEVDLWEWKDPAVDYQALATALPVTGLPPEQAQAFVLFRERPDLLELYAQPTQSFEVADMLARLAETPWRLALLDGISDPDELTEKAERLERLAQKRRAEQDAQPMMPLPEGPVR